MITSSSEGPANSGNIASIDIGSHTARLLIAGKTDSPELFKPILRKRAYIRLAEGFVNDKGGDISPEAIRRTLDVLEEFVLTAQEYSIDNILAVSTGIVRKAFNRKIFLNLIKKETGINVKVVSGEEEARLTKKGVLKTLKGSSESAIIFDLGGGTTEFIYGSKESSNIRSIPLGCVILTQKFLNNDPPEKNEVDNMACYIDKVLEGQFQLEMSRNNFCELIGSGGTITTIAAMLNKLPVNEITPEKLNGLKLRKHQIIDLFSNIKSIPVNEMLKITGLDPDRAGVILAGVLAVIKVMGLFNFSHVTVSCSDIIEGILISHLEGGRDEY